MTEAEFDGLRAEYSALKRRTLTEEGMRFPEPGRLLELRELLGAELRLHPGWKK